MEKRVELSNVIRDVIMENRYSGAIVTPFPPTIATGGLFYDYLSRSARN